MDIDIQCTKWSISMTDHPLADENPAPEVVKETNEDTKGNPAKNGVAGKTAKKNSLKREDSIVPDIVIDHCEDRPRSDDEDEQEEPQITRQLDEGNVIHKGGCHCGCVKWEVEGPKEIVAVDCKGIPPENIYSIKKIGNKGEGKLTSYMFNHYLIKHKFCRKCGVQSFFTGRIHNVETIGIMPHCIDSDSIEKITFKEFDGKSLIPTVDD